MDQLVATFIAEVVVDPAGELGEHRVGAAGPVGEPSTG
jgi:hypothetical protein